MRKQGSAGGAPAQSVLKRPAALATLQFIGDINQFRDRCRELGVAIKYRNASGKWVHRSKADMLDECRQLLTQTQGRDAIRARAAELGVQRYKGNSSGGRTTWRTAADLHADCDKATSLAQNNSLPSFFDMQVTSRRAPDSEL